MATKNLNVKKGNSTSVEMTKEEIREFARCVKDPVYFITKYVYVRHPVKGQTLFNLYDYQVELINAYHNNKDVITLLPRQSGKDLALDTEILTPSGFKPIKDIHPGDYVFGEDGLPTLVIDESIIFNNHEMYKVSFDDNTHLIASDTHQWTVCNRKRSHKQYTLTTNEILQSRWKRKNSRGYDEYTYYIPNTQPVEFPSKTLHIDPYLLGCWLGDGSSYIPNFTCHKAHAGHFIKNGLQLERIPYKGQETDNAPTYRINNLTQDDLRKYGLLQRVKETKTKRIPGEYLTASISDRVALLQGLMDTDGFINSRGVEAAIQLTNKNELLISDIEQLLWTLGLKPSKRVYNQTNSTRLSFIVGRSSFDLFRIPHKLNRQLPNMKKKRYSTSRTITNIEYVGNSIPSKCISVSNKSHLYLAGKALVPTHNSETSCAYLFWFSIFNKDKTVLITSNKAKNSSEMISRIKYMYENLPNFLKPGVTDDGWNKLSLRFETGSRIISDATSETTGRGGSFSILYADELGFVRPTIQSEFWASISPTLATGGKLFMTSTPNGDSDLFATLWRGAVSKTNGMKPLTIKWSDVPGRDESFKKKEIAKNGELKWRQEFECCRGEEMVTVQDENGFVFNISLENLYLTINHPVQ